MEQSRLNGWKIKNLTGLGSVHIILEQSNSMLPIHLCFLLSKVTAAPGHSMPSVHTAIQQYGRFMSPKNCNQSNNIRLTG